MIQPNEKLLPGNVVIYHGGESGDMICRLDADDVHNIAIGFPDDIKNHSPIPLTPEILVQWCGWYKLTGVFEIQINDFLLTVDLQTKLLSIENKYTYIDGLTIKFPEHLHTLQNTVYFLSGEEMPVNIPNH